MHKHGLCVLTHLQLNQMLTKQKRQEDFIDAQRRHSGSCKPRGSPGLLSQGPTCVAYLGPYKPTSMVAWPQPILSASLCSSTLLGFIKWSAHVTLCAHTLSLGFLAAARSVPSERITSPLLRCCDLVLPHIYFLTVLWKG